MKVLVTDGSYSNALAAVRSLGRAGHEVHCGSDSRHAQCFWSRSCSGRMSYPAPAKDEAGFVKAVDSYAHANGIDVVLPIGYDCTTALSRNLQALKTKAGVPVADPEPMRTAASKELTMELAKSVGVETPKTYASKDEVDGFPVVVKSSVGSGGVRYVNSEEELLGTDTDGAVIQEYVPGEGYGFFALFNEGKLRAEFMHRRIREFPVTGGASTAAVSVRVEALEDAGMRLLGGLRWHGVVMAEFKKDLRDGRFKLMEVNPKFWGSLDLAIASGVDFPLLTARMAHEGDVEPVLDYRVGVRFRWLLPGEALRAVAMPSTIPGLFAECTRQDTHTDIRLDDIGPNIVQMAGAGAALAKALRAGSLRYPHGVPGVRR